MTARNKAVDEAHETIVNFTHCPDAYAAPSALEVQRALDIIRGALVEGGEAVNALLAWGAARSRNQSPAAGESLRELQTKADAGDVADRLFKRHEERADD